MRKRCGKIGKCLGSAKGFTLLEAVISMAVFSIGILGMAALQSTSINNNSFAATVQKNTCTAMSQSEEFLATDYSDLRLKNNLEGCRITSDNGYKVCWDPDENSLPGTRRVIITSISLQKEELRTEHARTTTLKIVKPFIDVVVN